MISWRRVRIGVTIACALLSVPAALFVQGNRGKASSDAQASTLPKRSGQESNVTLPEPLTPLKPPDVPVLDLPAHAAGDSHPATSEVAALRAVMSDSCEPSQLYLLAETTDNVTAATIACVALGSIGQEQSLLALAEAGKKNAFAALLGLVECRTASSWSFVTSRAKLLTPEQVDAIAGAMAMAASTSPSLLDQINGPSRGVVLRAIQASVERDGSYPAHFQELITREVRLL